MNDTEKQAYLVRAGAGRIPHSGRTLLAHLMGTRDHLRRWSLPAYVQDAGLFHSVFGTHAFRHSTLSLLQAHEVHSLIGPDAYALVIAFSGELRGVRILEALTAQRDEPSHEFRVHLALLEAANLYDQHGGETYFRRLLAVPDVVDTVGSLAHEELASRVGLRELPWNGWANADFSKTLSPARPGGLSGAISGSYLHHSSSHIPLIREDARKKLTTELRIGSNESPALEWGELASLGLDHDN